MVITAGYERGACIEGHCGNQALGLSEFPTFGGLAKRRSRQGHKNIANKRSQRREMYVGLVKRTRQTLVT